MPRHPKKIKASRSNRFEQVPNEVLVREVLGRVAAASSTDLFNFKLSCKTINEICEDKYVYQRVSLDKFPNIVWDNEKQKSFLNKCQEFENPEALYRLAVFDYFNRGKRRRACRHLEKAIKFGHTGARYLAFIIMIISGDPNLKLSGIKRLSEFKKSNTGRDTKLCRNNLNKMLGEMWVFNTDLKDASMCCSNPDQHQSKNDNSWNADDVLVSECEACGADREIKMIVK